MNNIHVNRHIFSYQTNYKDILLHGFCDASNEAYGAVVYLQIVNNNGKVTNLLTKTYQFHASNYYRVYYYQNWSPQERTVRKCRFVKYFVGMTHKWRYSGSNRSVRFGRFGFQIGCV